MCEHHDSSAACFTLVSCSRAALDQLSDSGAASIQQDMFTIRILYRDSGEMQPAGQDQPCVHIIYLTCSKGRGLPAPLLIPCVHTAWTSSSSFPSLERLVLANNPHFGGQLPAEMAGPPSLRQLNMSSCGLHGHLPSRLPASLTNLSLTHNYLSGKACQGILPVPMLSMQQSVCRAGQQSCLSRQYESPRSLTMSMN